MKQEKMEVAVFGALNIDITGTATVPFSSGQSLPAELRFSTGGTGWNIARSAALLGAKTGFFSLLGADGYEQTIRDDAQKCGLNIEGCLWEKAANNCLLRILDINGAPVGSVNDMNFSRRMDEFFIKDAARRVPEVKAVVCECNLQAAALRRLTEELPEVPIVADAVSAAKCMRLENLLPRLHTLKADLQEAQRLAGFAGPERCATALLKKGVQRVCITMDAEGLLLADTRDMLRYPLLTEGTLDRSGAGDAVTAALAVSLARGMDLEQSAKLALAAAAVNARDVSGVSPELSRLRSYVKGN